MMKNKRTFFGRLLRGAAVTALSAVLFSALPALKAKAAAGEVWLSADGTGTLTLSGEVTKEQIWNWRGHRGVIRVTAKKGTVLPADCSSLFQDNYDSNNIGKLWPNLVSVDLHNADTSNVTNMRGMFENCYKLTSLDLHGCDTSNVTTMGRMFEYCCKLTSLNLRGCNTSNVTTMMNMFANCWELTALDTSGFDTSNVNNMSGVFFNCAKLTSLDLHGFDTSKVTDMSYMFGYCRSLTSLDLSRFATSNAEQMYNMFFECNSLTSLDLRSFDTSKVISMNEMFQGCRNLTSLDLSSFDTSKVQGMEEIFRGCRNLTSLDLSSFDTSNVVYMNAMFENCNSLTSLDLSSFDTSDVSRTWGMFDGCTNLTSLDLSSFDTSNVIYMGPMFRGCEKLTSIYVADRWSMQSLQPVKDSDKMFEGCASLTGGNGTKYTTDHMDTEYARIDAAGRPGYFTSSFFRSMPKNAYGTVAENAVFTVKATGKNLKYQWQYNNGHGWRNSTQEGCKTATLSVPFLYYRNGQQYRCIVTDAAGKKHISSAAKLYVTLITAQPADVTAAAGKNAVFTVQTAGKNLNYCWQFNNGHGWKNSSMTGCKTASLTVPAAATRNGQRYRCIVTASNGIREISKEVMMYVK